MLKRFYRWNDRLSVWIVPAALVLALFGGMLLFQRQNAYTARRQAYSVLTDSAEEQIGTFNATLNGQFTALEILAALLSDEDELGRALLLRRLSAAKSASEFTSISFILPDGEGISSDGEGFHAEDRPYFTAALRGERGIQFIGSGRIESTPHIGLSVPVTRDGQRIGVLLAIYGENRLREQIDSHVYGESGYSFICDGTGRIIVSTDASNFLLAGGNVLTEIQNAEVGEGYSAEALQADFAAHRAGMVSYTYSGHARYAVYQPLDVGDWMLFSAIPHEAVDARTAEVITSGWFATGTVAIVAVLLLLYIVYREQRRKDLLEREKELLRRSEELYRAVENLSEVVLFDADAAGGAVRFNPNYVIEFGRTPPIQTLDELPAIRTRIWEEDWPRWDAFVQSVFASSETPPAEVRVLVQNRASVWYRIECKTLLDDAGKPYRIVGKLTNIDAHVRSMEKLQSRAENDSLTNLLNHETTRLRIDSALSASAEGSTHALLIIDLDNFKNVNDQNGHFEGDRTLIQLATELRRLFRVTDVIGRIGGDEFIVFLPNVGTEALAESKAAELCGTLQFTHASGDRNTVVTCSVGVAIAAGSALRFDELYQRADHALYEAKEQGKARYVVVHANEPLPENAAGTEIREIFREGSAIVQLRALLEHMDGGVMLFELRKEHIHAIYISPSYYKMSGSAPKAFSEDRDIASVMHPDDVDMFASALRSGAESGQVVDSVYRTIRTDGGSGWRHLRAVHIPYEESDYPVMIGVITDVTALRESALRFQAILDNAPCGIGLWEVGARVRFQFANDGVLDLLRCTRTEFELHVQGDFYPFVYPEDVEPLETAVHRALDAKTSFECVCRVLAFSDGKPRWTLLRGKQIDEKDGVPVCLVTLMDINREKSMERELAMSNELITLALTQTNALVWEYEFESACLTVFDLQNGGFREGTVFEHMPKSFLEDKRVHPASEQDFAELCAAVQRGDREGKAHLLLRMGQRYRWSRVSFRTLFGNGDEPQRAIGISTPTSNNAFPFRPAGS